MSRNAVSRKVFFNLVKDLCKLNEGWSRSVSIPVSSESEGIFDLDSLRKKYSCPCQILHSKGCRCAVSRKVFFNLVKGLCNLNEGWSRGVRILVGSESKRIFDLGCPRKRTHVVVKFRAYKCLGMQFHEKCFSI